jgi:hypothetical protein
MFNTTEKTYREKVRAVVQLIFHLDLVDFEDRFINWPHLVPSCSLDGNLCLMTGTHCFINEHRPFDSDYGSFKMKHSALAYEIGMALGCSKIVWWNGGVAAGANPDLELARAMFVDGLKPGEQAAADKGYQDGNTHFYTPHRQAITADQRQFNWNHKKMMARHEMINKRVKQFEVLNQWRHLNDDKHKICFGAVVNLTQLELEENPLPPLGF